MNKMKITKQNNFICVWLKQLLHVLPYSLFKKVSTFIINDDDDKNDDDNHDGVDHDDADNEEDLLIKCSKHVRCQHF